MNGLEKGNEGVKTGNSKTILKIEEKPEGVIRAIEDKDVPTDMDIGLVDPDAMEARWKNKRRKLRGCYEKFGTT